MNTTPVAFAVACADAWLAIRRVFQTFTVFAPAADSREWKLLIREWAVLAAVPPGVIESTFYGGGISCEQDARRILATAMEMERRIVAAHTPRVLRENRPEAELPGLALS